jgi:hypothetical protein
MWFGKKGGADPSGSTLATAVASNASMRRTLIEEALRRLAPKVPSHEFGAVVDHALGSRGLRNATPEIAAWLSLVAYVRHALTEYDDLLAQGYDQDSARYFVADEINEVLAAWGARRTLAEEE